PAPGFDRLSFGAGGPRRWVQGGAWGWVGRKFSLGPAGRCGGGGSGGGKEMRGRRSGRLGSSVGTRYKPARRWGSGGGKERGPRRCGRRGAGGEKRTKHEWRWWRRTEDG